MLKNYQQESLDYLARQTKEAGEAKRAKEQLTAKAYELMAAYNWDFGKAYKHAGKLNPDEWKRAEGKRW